MTYGIASPEIRFTDVTEKLGISPLMKEGAAFGDYDNDGDIDLYLFSGPLVKGANFLYSNNGDGTFTDVTEMSGVGNGVKQTTAAIWGDYDNDGDLDLYVVNAGEDVLFQKPEADPDALYRNNGDGTFTDVIEGSGIRVWSPITWATWGDFDADGLLDLLGSDKKTGVLYRNNGDGTFSDVTDLVGIAEVREGAAVDYDNDGDLDLFAGWLYRNDGKGHFEKGFFEILRSGEGLGSSGGISWGDLNNDGLLDLISGGIYLNRGGNVMQEEPEFARLTEIPADALLKSLGDYDGDGDLDLAAVFEGGGDVPSWVFFYRNEGEARFVEVGREVGLSYSGDFSPFRGGGVAWADYDADGDVDLYIAGRFYRNEGNDNDWLTVRTVGRLSPRDGVGAKVKVWSKSADGPLFQVREVGTGGAVGSQNSLQLEFGLGKSAAIDSVGVIWPSGVVQTLYDVEKNRGITIEEQIFGHDVMPQGGAYKEEERLPKGIVRNTGASDEEHIPVTCSIRFAEEEVYRETVEIPRLGSLHTHLVSFPEWTPPENGVYDMLFSTHLEGDENPRNDLRSIRAKIHRTDIDTEEKDTNIPDRWLLFQNYPNPFNRATTIGYEIPKGSKVSLMVYNILGEKVKELVSEHQRAGRYDVLWDSKDEHGEEVGTGVYFCRLESEGWSMVKKVVILR